MKLLLLISVLLALSKGLVAIVPDLHGGNPAPDFRALFAPQDD